MTLQEIYQRALQQADEDTDQLDDRRTLLHQAVNEAYADLFAAAQPLWVEDVDTAEDGRIDLSALPGGCTRVLQAEVGGQAAAFAEDGPQAIRLPGACRVRLSYRSRPGELRLPTDAPALPERFHGALADYASYCLLGTGGRGRQARGDFFLARFLRARSSVSFDTGDPQRGRLRNKY